MPPRDLLHRLPEIVELSVEVTVLSGLSLLVAPLALLAWT
jgi:hypothetical protein